MGSEISHTVFRVDSNDQNLWLESIDSNGSVQRQTIAHTDYLPRIMWVMYQGSWWVATQTMNDEWQLIQPETHQQMNLTTPPLLQLPNGRGAKLKPASTAWEILDENGEIIPIPYEGLTALAPNGKAVASLRERKAFLWQEGHEIETLLPGEAADWEIISLIWTPMIWVKPT